MLSRCGSGDAEEVEVDVSTFPEALWEMTLLTEAGCHWIEACEINKG